MKRDHARASTCTAVPWERPLVHGGEPPSNWNRYSHAMPPARWVASGSDFAQQLAQVGVFVSAEVVAVGLAEGPEPLDLDALTGVVLPHEQAAGKADAHAA